MAKKNKVIRSTKDLLAGETPESLHKRLRKNAAARFDFRCTECEKAEIAAAAKKYGLTMTDYLKSLHHLAREIASGKTGRQG